MVFEKACILWRRRRRHDAGPLVTLGLGTLCAVSCAHSDESGGEAPTPPPIQAEVEVTGLKLEERQVLEEAVCSLPQISACQMKVEVEAPAAKKKRGRKVKRRQRTRPAAADDPTAIHRSRLIFIYQGTLPQLRAALARLSHPDLEIETAAVHLRYRGFDNIAPEIRISAPQPNSVHTVSKVEIVAEVLAADVLTVRIGDEKVRKKAAGLYTRQMTLPDGNHKIDIVAVDKDDNEGTSSIHFLVDTTPPTITAAVTQGARDRVVIACQVEGATSVTVDGLPVDDVERFSKNLPSDPDKSEALIVATDPHGNTTTLPVVLQDGWTGRAGP